MRFRRQVAVLLAVLLSALVGCSSSQVSVAPTEPPENFESLPAIWAHELSVTRFVGYAPGEYCVESMIRDATAVRYMVLIKVAKLGVPYVTEQLSPDGTELETLEMKLTAGSSPDELVAEFTHTLSKNNIEVLRFSGVTMLPKNNIEVLRFSGVTMLPRFD
jgi:hypothetical protein